MKKIVAYTFLTAFLMIIALKGYKNYQSYPKPHVNINKFKNELDIFYGLRPWAKPEYSTSYELTNKTSKKDFKKS